jgi:hypothetical protein
MTHDVSPLQEIERRVQLRAKETSLDMASEGGRDRLRSLIAEEVAAWSDAYKRGLRAFDLAEPEVVAERAYRNIAGYGPLEPLLADDDVWEIMIVGRRHLHSPRKCRSRAMSLCSEVPRITPYCAPLVVQMWCRNANRQPVLRRQRRRQVGVDGTGCGAWSRTSPWSVRRPARVGRWPCCPLRGRRRAAVALIPRHLREGVTAKTP